MYGHLSFELTYPSSPEPSPALTPLESALIQVFILGNLKLFRMNTSKRGYRKAAPIRVNPAQSVTWNGGSGQQGTAGVGENDRIGNTGNTPVAARGR
jgi:hypothetical protein